MNRDLIKPDLPIIKASEKYPQSAMYLFQLSLFLKFIRERIYRREKKYKENFQSKQYLLNITQSVKLSLDIKSFYSFFQDYLNYLVIFLYDNYFYSSIKFITKTFKSHYHKINTTESFKNPQKLNEYKKVLRNYAPELLEKISLVRDKMIVHRKPKIDEFFSYDPSTSKISTIFIEPFKKKPKTPKYIINEDINDLYKILIDFIKAIKKILQ
jgi:hypothetical protein